MSYSRAAFGDETSPETGAPASLPSDVAKSAVHQVAFPVERQRGWVAVPSYDMRQYVQTQVIVAAVGFGFGLTVGALMGNFLKGKKVPGLGSLMSNPGRTTKRKLRRYLVKASSGFQFEVQAYSRKGALQQAKQETSDDVRIVRSELVKNAGKRRTTARRRKRGRPTTRVVVFEEMVVKMPNGTVNVVIERGVVRASGRRVGTMYDTGTMFRRVPMAYDAPGQAFTTMAGAAKHLIRVRARA
jgi:hypothetical protein